MKHEHFVAHLAVNGFPPCGSPGCKAHIPCGWLTQKSSNDAAERHKLFLFANNINAEAEFLKISDADGGWCLLWARDGKNNGSGSYLIPKCWVKSRSIIHGKAPVILNGRYKLAFELFRLQSGGTKISCRSMLLDFHEHLIRLRDHLRLEGPKLGGQIPSVSESSVVLRLGRFSREDDYAGIGKALNRSLGDFADPKFKDFVLLAPAFIPL